MDKFSFKDVLVTFVGLFITTFIGWILITATGNNPSEVAKYLYEGGFKGTRNIANSLYQATPLILTATATLISFRVGMFNIGINGSMYVGALYAGWAGYRFTNLGHFSHVSLCILIGMTVGALWMLLPALLRVYAGVSEIISTIILNFVAILFVSYMANGPFRADPIAPATARIMETAELKQIFPNSQFSTGFFIAVFVALVAHFVLNKTTFGYELRSGGDGLVGRYPSRFSSYLGIPSDRSAITGMLISGAIGGLAGAIEVLGAVRYFFQELEFNQGFDGILIGILGKLEPIGAIIASLFYGAIKNGGFFVDYKTDVAREIIVVLISVLIFFVSAQKIVKGLEKYPIIKKLDSFFSRKKM
jgi:ABC-type uncharacterized transport system permease subunit